MDDSSISAVSVSVGVGDDGEVDGAGLESGDVGVPHALGVRQADGGEASGPEDSTRTSGFETKSAPDRGM
jgi:hypothetical protein